MADTLQIGSVVFDYYDLPEEVNMGGEQMLNIRHYPGGVREVQVFGPQPDPIAWSGTFNFNGAVQKMNTLLSMYESGKVWPLFVGSVYKDNVVISKFKPRYRSQIEIPYDIELEVAPSKSIVTPPPTAQPTTTTVAGQTITVAPTKPQTVSPKPQKVYIVKQNDTLIAISAREYGDPSQYRKIAAANNIPDPNKIRTGQKLVIP